MKKEIIEYPYLEKPVSVYTLDNGHKIVIANFNSKMANVSTWVKTGSINENDVNNGVSHFLEHLMFKGTNQFKAGEFDKMLERKGGIINAATWKDYTFYYVTISKQNIDLAIKMHADMMIDPILPDVEIGPAFDIKKEIPEEKRERYVVLEEIKMRADETWNKVYMTLNDAMYEKHPYKREVIGTPEIISSIARDEIMNYYLDFYTPDNMTTIVVGDFNEDEILEKVKKEFNFKNTKKVSKQNFEPEHKIKNPAVIEKTSDINSGYLMFGFLADSAKNLKETIALDLLSSILGDGKSSRLNEKFIEKAEKPHYYFLSTSHYQFKDGDNFFIEANFDPAFKDEVIEEIKKELDNLTSITDEELKKAKKKALISFAQDAETVSNIADSIGFYMTVCEDLTYPKEYEKTLKEIDTNYLIEIAKKYLNKDMCSISILMPEKK